MYTIILLYDCIEIFFYSSCIFLLCQWLKTDKTKNIIFYFFAYCALTIGAWIAQLPTLAPFLCTYAPVALLLFIIFHERTLQKNLVSLHTIAPLQSEQKNWLDILLSSSLTIINANKAVTIVIEHKDALNYFLNAPFFINADIGKNILDILLSSTLYDEQKMIWINTSGTIRSINTTWLTSLHNDKENNAFFCTQHTDAIIIHAHPANRTFTIIIAGKETHNLSAHHVRMIIKKQLSHPSKSRYKGVYRERVTTEKFISR